jgi:hypothetical protein
MQRVVRNVSRIVKFRHRPAPTTIAMIRPMSDFPTARVIAGICATDSSLSSPRSLSQHGAQSGGQSIPAAPGLTSGLP